VKTNRITGARKREEPNPSISFENRINEVQLETGPNYTRPP
jgi:hypothetical protein